MGALGPPGELEKKGEGPWSRDSRKRLSWGGKIGVSWRMHGCLEGGEISTTTNEEI